MFPRTCSIVMFSLFLFSAAGESQANDIIDFEMIPGDTAEEGLLIDDQFLSTHGVTFRLEGTTAKPRLAKVGEPVYAFAGYPNDDGADTPAPDQAFDIGDFFLTDDAAIGLWHALIIEYATPVSAASGHIIDIDGAATGQSGWHFGENEQFTVEARASNGDILDSVILTAGDPLTGDGMVTPWWFDIGTEEIHSIRIDYTGTKPESYVGLAFDNFSPSEVPEPASLSLLLIGAGAAMLLRRRAA